MQYNLAATGGTFDIIHAGHRALLDHAFAVAKHVIIGLSGDRFATRKGKTLLHTYDQRRDLLSDLLDSEFADRYTISMLDDDFGPAILEDDVQALVVSQETSFQGDILNDMRRARGCSPVDVVVVPMILASDGCRISTTRIRNSEIDTLGRLIQLDKKTTLS